MSCKKCLLGHVATSVNVPGDTHRRSAGRDEPVNWCFVGMNPGIEEDRQGKCFVGPTGVVLRSFIDKTIPSHSVRLENAVRCYHGAYDIEPAIEACRPKLMKALAKHKPERIVALGSVAIQSFFGHEVPPITQVVGGWAWFEIPGLGKRQVLFQLHPSAMLRNNSLKPYWNLMMANAVKRPPDVHWKGPEDVRSIVVRSDKRMKKVFAKLEKAKLMALDTEYNDKTNRLLCLAVSCEPNKAYVFPDTVCQKPIFKKLLLQCLGNSAIRKAAQNWKFDAWVLVRSLGFPVSLFTQLDDVWYDTSSMRKIYDPEQLSRLEISDWMVGMGGHKEEMQSILRGNTGLAYEKAYDQYPNIVMRYCGLDAIACYRLVVYYYLSLKREKLLPAWDEVTGPLGNVLFQLESNGVRVDRKFLEESSIEFQSIIDSHMEAIQKSKPVRNMVKAGIIKPGRDGVARFNPRSTLQKRELLFGEHGLGLLPVGKTKAGGATTDRDTITYLGSVKGGKTGELLTHLDLYNKFEHKKSTYIDGYLKRIVEENGEWFIHPNYRQDVARTFRLSCQNPNLQNIPNPNRGNAEDVYLRKFLLPLTDDDVLMEVDYSQVEMRKAGELSGDPVMLRCFVDNVDIHRLTASEVLGVALEDVTKTQRQNAKPVNFGLIFNMSAHGLQSYASNEYGVDMTAEEAEIWRRNFFRTYKVYRGWMIRELAMARRRGCAYVYWNGKPFRRRWLPDLGSSNWGRKGHAERQVLNTPIQGGAAELMMRSLIGVHKLWLDGKIPGLTGICATIHDSLVMSVKRNKKKSTFKKVAQVMCVQPAKNNVPWEVEAKVGDNFADMVEFGTYDTRCFKVA